MLKGSRCFGSTFSGNIGAVRRMGVQGFKVRRLTTPEEVYDGIFARAGDEGWRPGALDHVSLYAADNKHFFVGELNGKLICSTFFVKFGYDYMYAGGLIVDKKYRGQGYALEISKSAYAQINRKYNIAGDSTLEALPFHARFGFIPQWCLQCFYINIQTIKMDNLQCTEIIQPSIKNFSALVKYDTHVHVYARQSFLEKWVFASNSHCSVALNNNKDVVGYGVIRTTLGEKIGWRIGPLFADNIYIATALYKDMLVKASAQYPQATVTLEVPYGNQFHPDSLKLVKELGGVPTFKMMRVYTEGVPPRMPTHKVFVMM